MPRAAYLRARRFLSYERRTVATAVVFAVLESLFFGLLLILLGLTFDLVAERGQLSRLPQPMAALSEWCNQWLAGAEDLEALQQRFREGDGLGLASLGVRSMGSWYGPIFSWPAAHLSWTTSNRLYLLGLLVLLVMVGIAYHGLSLLMQSAATRASLGAILRLRRTVYLHALRLGQTALPGTGKGEAVTAFTRDLDTVHEALLLEIKDLVSSILKIAVAVALAVGVDLAHGWPWLTTVLLIVGLLYWLGGVSSWQGLQQNERRHALAAAELMTLLRECLGMTRLVRGYQMDAFNRARVERFLHRLVNHQRERLFHQALHREILGVQGILVLAALLFVVGWCTLDDGMTLGQTLTILAALGAAYPSFRRLVQRQKAIQLAQRAAFGLFRFLDHEGDVRQLVGAEFLPPLSRTVEFKNVTVREAEHGQPILRHLDLRLQAGQKIVLMSQDEKECRTLVYLLPRLLDPEEGEITFDERRTTNVSLDSLRGQIALILRDDYVFNDTVANNIGCGDTTRTQPQIIEAAKLAHAHKFIQGLAKGYDTVIGELGHPLSQGEQLRIALARAILRDPALVVIEEPKGPLDEETKDLIDDTLDRFLPGRTVIFLPHRLSTIKHADQIIVLHQGKVDAAGSYNEIVRKSERFRHLLYVQFNLFSEEG